jgi:polysaccharide deacetylase family protein (PEP-CTERM system associated)
MLPAKVSPLPAPLTNAFTIDVEDYFQVWAFHKVIDRAQWDSFPRRVEANTDRCLQLLADTGVKATFFTLGWVAKRHPGIVKRIVAQGHEIASHGDEHRLIYEQTPEAFRADVLRAKRILEDIGGTPVLGYRAPSFSIAKTTPWAHKILAEAGHVYSSSVYPIAHDHYGIPDAPRFAYRTPSGITEIPATSLRLGGKNRPGSGGGFFRLFPLPLSRWMIHRVNQVDRQSAVFYFHPWEIDPDQPRIQNAPMKSRFRHYVRLPAMYGKLEALLKTERWGRMDTVFAAQIAQDG